MKLLNRIAKTGIFARHKVLEWFPPFAFMGVRFESVSEDNRRFRLSLPLRWYGKNPHGTMFGGFICAVADPLPALVCHHFLKDHEVWTQSNHVDFKKPARGRVYMTFEFSPEDESAIRSSIERAGKCSHCFRYEFTDAKDNVVAEVRNTVYVRKRKSIRP